MNTADWLNLTNVAATVGLLLFASMQWWLMKRHEQNHLRERGEDHLRALTAAYGSLWAETQRIHVLQEMWAEEDLLNAALAERLDASEVLPTDWAILSAALGQLGLESAELGGAARVHAHGLYRMVVDFVSVANEAAPLDQADLSTRRAMAIQYAPHLTEWEERIKGSLAELNHLWLDCLEHTPVADRPRNVRYKDQLHSQTAREVVRVLRASQESSGSTSDGDPKTGS